MVGSSSMALRSAYHISFQDRSHLADLKHEVLVGDVQVVVLPFGSDGNFVSVKNIHLSGRSNGFNIIFLFHDVLNHQRYKRITKESVKMQCNDFQRQRWLFGLLRLVKEESAETFSN